MKILIFDVETTGLAPKNKDIIHSHKFPYVVQLSWLVYDIHNNKYGINDYLVRLPDGVKIPEEATAIHGITNKMILGGEDIMRILVKFLNDYSKCNVIIAHNLEFDKKMMDVEFYRNGFNRCLNRFRKKLYCTMRSSEELCGLTMISKYTGLKISKFPKLCELHTKLFSKSPKNTHNALIDILMCFRCYYKMEYGVDILEKNEKFNKLYNMTCKF